MANRYWVGDSGNFNDTAHWSTSSGGASGASVPSNSDDVIFDANSFSSNGQTVTLVPYTESFVSAGIHSKSITFSAITKTITIAGSGHILATNGNVVFSNKVTVSITGAYQIRIDSINSFSLNGVTFTNNPSRLQISFTGTFNWSEDLNLPGTNLYIYVPNNGNTGTFNTNNYNFTLAAFHAEGQWGGGIGIPPGSTLTLNLGTSTFNLNPTDASLLADVDTRQGFTTGSHGSIGATGTTNLNGDNCTINFTPDVTINYSLIWVSDNSTGTGKLGTINILPGLGDVQFIGMNTTGTLTVSTPTVSETEVNIYGSNTFSTIVVNGTSGHVVYINGDGTGPGTTLTSTNTPTFTYVRVKDITAAGATNFIAYNGTDSGGNVNWVFPPIANFTGTPLSGLAPLQVTFTDTSTGGTIDTWEWDFKNDGSALSGDQNPQYTYANAGIFTVMLTVSNVAGSSVKTRVAYITVTIRGAFLQTTKLAGADTAGDVQTLNVGKDDDGEPIYYELETQELEFGNRLTKKEVEDKLVVFSENANDSNLQIIVDEKNAQNIDDIDFGKRVAYTTLPKLLVNYLIMRWFGNATKKSPVLEGFYFNKVEDKGVQKD